MPEFCASIVLAFISGVKLLDYVVMGGGGGICESLAGGRKPSGGYGLKMTEGLNPQNVMTCSIDTLFSLEEKNLQYKWSLEISVAEFVRGFPPQPSAPPFFFLHFYFPYPLLYPTPF